MRRARALAAFIGALCILPTLARGAITDVYSTRSTGTGANAGFDIVRWFARFTPGSDEDGSGGLLTAGVTMQADKAFKFLTYNPGSGNTLDLTGGNTSSRGNNGTVTPFNNNNTIATFIAVRKFDAIYDPTANDGDGQNDQGNFYIAFSAINPSTAPGNTQATSPFSGYLYSGTTPPSDPAKQIKEFRVEGTNQASVGTGTLPDPSAKSTDPNGSRGALFAVAVVPTDTTVRILAAGFIANNRKFALFDAGGRETNFGTTVFENAVPEPGTLSIVGIGILGLLARRSRRAA